MLVLFKDLKSLIDVDEEDKLFLISPAINVEKGHVVVHLWQCPRMRGVHRKALILNANVFNHCIRYKIPSGPVNIVGSFKYLVHLYFQYMSAAKLHQSCRTCHIIFNVEYLKLLHSQSIIYQYLFHSVRSLPLLPRLHGNICLTSLFNEKRPECP